MSVKELDNDFVPHDVAIILAEIGFNGRCFTSWGIQTRNENGELTPDEPIMIPIPTYHQAFRWFREKHGLFISFVRYRNSVVIEIPDTFSKVYEIWIQDENKDESIWVGGFDGQEEAELACLNKLIDLAKKK